MGFLDKLNDAHNRALDFNESVQAKQMELKAKKAPKGRKISEVGTQTAAGLQCPKCGGTQFKAKRSAFGKTVGAVIALPLAALAPKTRVKCVTCGTTYHRG
jgi:ssDNA-binding Zn-finger/Zn-ribbon topoisomerase 1